MPFKFLEGLTVADVAFQAEGRGLPELFASAARATESVMVEGLKSIEPRVQRKIRLEGDSVDSLLFNFLSELVFLKDAEKLLFSGFKVKVKKEKDRLILEAALSGEKLDPKKHVLLADVKAVTRHKFEVKKTRAGWSARVILDI